LVLVGKIRSEPNQIFALEMRLRRSAPLKRARQLAPPPWCHENKQLGDGVIMNLHSIDAHGRGAEHARGERGEGIRLVSIPEEGSYKRVCKMRALTKNDGKPPQYHERIGSIYYVKRLLPGVLLCAAITLAAIALERIEVFFVGQAYLEALVLAILLGVAVRTAWTPGSSWHEGINFSAKFVLEFAIVLLGASVSITMIAALGSLVILGIACIVALAIGTSYFISRFFGLPQRMSILIACGNSICGNSAIAAVAPVIGADADDIASSISFTAVLGVLVVLGLPFLVPILQLSLTQYGVLAGLTVYAVPQVLAATLPIGALSNQVGTVIKLVRVLMLGPVVLGLSLLANRVKPARDRLHRRKPRFNELVPWFIVGFLVVLAVRSMGLIPQSVLPAITWVAALLTTIAMAALGLGVDIRVVARSGARVTLAVTVSLIVLGVMSYGLIRLTGMP
jgi:uncharacterized integral membrane protein (TIGR00698 family)